MSPPSSLIRHLLIALLLIAAVVGSRAPWLDHGIWTLDEGSTFTMAQQVLEGGVLYRDAADNRSPLMPYLKAGILAIAGDWNIAAVHTVLAVGLGFSAFLLFCIARRLDPERPATAFGTAGAFVLLQLLYVDVGDALSANTEWFVVLFSTAGFALLVRSIERPNLSRGIPAGLLFGLAVLCKQPGLLDAVVATVLIALQAIPANADRRGLLRYWCGLTLGVVSPLIVAAIYFAANNAWDDYLYYAFTFNTSVYLPEVPLGERLLCIRQPFAMAWDHVPVLMLIGIVGAIALLVFVSRRSLRRPPVFPLLPWLILGWTASGLISTTLSGREFAHYSEQVIPGLSLAIGWTLAGMARWTPRRMPRLGPALAVVAVAGIAVSSVLRWRQVAESIASIGSPLIALGQRIAAHTAPDERIFVWGYYPELHVAARRLPATRYVYANYISGMIAWTNLDSLKDARYGIAPGGWEKFHADFALRPPALLIDTGTNRGYAKFPLAGYPRLWAEITAHYAEIAPGDPGGMRLFRRLDEAPPAVASPEAPMPQDATIRMSAIDTWVRNETPTIQVDAPAGATAVELWQGVRRLAVLPYPAQQPVAARFFVAQPLTSATPFHAVLRFADGSGRRSTALDFGAFLARRSQPHPTDPQLKLVSGPLPPVLIESAVPEAPEYLIVPGSVQLHAPARLIYDCPVTVTEVEFQHGIMPSVADMSDGYDIVVRWESDGREPTTLGVLRVPVKEEGRYRMPQRDRLPLPRREPGRLVFEFRPGKESDARNDHLYFGPVEAAGVGANFLFDGRLYSQLLAPSDPLPRQLGEDRLVFHAPHRLVWPHPPGLAVLEFDYGIENGAYPPADGRTDGVVFRLTRVGHDGENRVLWERYLDPTPNPADRGPQRAQIGLPREPGAQLILTASTGPNNSDAWDWSWISQDVVALPPGPPLRLDDGRVLPTVARHGFQDGWSALEQPGQWSAHAPREMVYAKPAGLHRITFRVRLPEAAVHAPDGSRRSDGIVAVLDFAPDGGEPIELFRRALDPFTRPEDAGWQTATVDLPAAATGRLRLRTEPGPNNNNSFDWALWGDLHGETRPIEPTGDGL